MSDSFLTLGRIVKSPLVHFFLIGAAIFVGFQVVSDRPEEQPADIITLTPEAAGRLADRFAATWRRPPTPKEMDGLMQSWALEEAFVREALTLGLDRGDAIIRQRLNQKMQFLAESVATVLEPDEAMLQTYLEENPDQFAQPSRIAFEQVFLPQDRDASEIIALLEDGSDPSTLGATSLLPPSLAMTPAPAIDLTFGEGFSVVLLELPIGEWQGPVESAYGMHIVRVTERAESALPSLSEIRDRVEAEWLAAKMKEMRESFGQALLERYTVSLPKAEAVLSR